MQLAEKVAVVTGGAAGIGRALALRFAAEGAAGVVVADLDQAGAEAVAAEIGEGALAFACDVADPAHADALIGAAESAFGPVDLFCANAGVAVGDGLGTPGRVGARARRQHPRARVRGASGSCRAGSSAARGYFLTTASAAGLAHADRLRALRGDQARRGRVRRVAVGHLRRPRRRRELPVPDGRQHRRCSATAPAATTAGRRAWSRRRAPCSSPRTSPTSSSPACATERFLILPHPEVLEFFRRKAADYDRWLAGMRRLQASVAAQRDA